MLFWFFTVMLLPLWFSFVLLLALINAIVVRGNPFFIQQRGGFKGKVFKIFKFKSMSDLRGDDGVLLDDRFRITKFGQFLRKSSLDELPSLFNVLLFQMTIVGPRPFISEYLDLYSAEHFKRHDVLPGITGWSQVNGRNTISWHDKFNLDLWYVENKSIKLDFKIIFLTFSKVIKMQDIDSGSDQTMPKYNGSN